MSPQPRFDLLAPASDHDPEDAAALRGYLAGDSALPSRLDDESIEALVDALVKRGDGERLGQLAASNTKGIAKAARRGIHVLRTRGVTVKVAAPAPAPAPRAAADSDEEMPCLVSTVLRDGEYAVWYSFSLPSGRVQLCQGQVNETAGLFRFDVYRTTRKNWRNIERTLGVESGVPMTHIPPQYARWLLEEGYRRALAAGRTPPRNYAESRAALGPVAPVERHPGFDVASEAAVRAVTEPERVLELVEARTWIPDEAMVRATLERLDAIDKSPIVLDGPQRAARRDEVIRAAAVDALNGGWRARLSRRLLDLAYFLTRASLEAQRGSRDYASDATLAIAGAFHMEDPSIAPADNRIALRMFHKLFDRIAETARPGAATAGSGGALVNP